MIDVVGGTWWDLDTWRDSAIDWICWRGFRYFQADTTGVIRFWGPL